MRADHVAGKDASKTASIIYEGNVPKSVSDGIEQGSILFRTGRLKLKEKFHGGWRTASLAPESSTAPN